MKVLRALVRRPAVALSLLYIVIVVLLALFAPWMSPYDPSEQFVEGLSLEGAPLPPIRRTCWAPIYSAVICCRG